MILILMIIIIITFTITIIIIIIFRIFSPPTRDVPQFQSSPTTPVESLLEAILTKCKVAPCELQHL